jgi:hypothetical protein
MQKNKIELKKVPKIHRSNIDFHFGNCASIAIAQAFSINEDTLNIVCKLLKIKNHKEGLSFFEIKKVINALSRQYKPEYTPNYGNLTYGQMLIVLNKGSYLTMFNEHLSFAINGEVYDSYWFPSLSYDVESLQNIPTGWWKIK